MNKPIRWILLLSFSLLLCFLCCSCLSAPRVTAPGFESALPLLGADKDDVVADLSLSAVIPTPSADGKQEDCVIGGSVDGAACQVCLTFQNGVFSSLQYTFPDTADAYAYSVRLREALGERFGAVTTQPIQSQVQHRFDAVQSADRLERSQLYYEDWTPDCDGAQMEKMLGGVAPKRVDVRFSLFTLEEGATVSVRLSAILPGAEESASSSP